jgi:hypothetical protein
VEEPAPLYQKKKSHRAAAGLTWSDGKTEGLADEQLEAVKFFFKAGACSLFPRSAPAHHCRHMIT